MTMMTEEEATNFLAVLQELDDYKIINTDAARGVLRYVLGLGKEGK